MRLTFRLRTSLIRSVLVVGLTATSFLALSGCVAVAAGAGAGVVAYVRGDLEATLAKDYGAAVDATRGAIKELEFAKISDNKDAFKAFIVARTAVDKKVEITLTNSGKELTSIKIRVGVFAMNNFPWQFLIKSKLVCEAWLAGVAPAIRCRVAMRS